VVSNAINDFRVHNHRFKSYQVRNKFANCNTAKENRESSLLVECNTVLFEQNRQRVLINFLVQPMPDFVQNFKGKTNNLFSFGFEKKFGFTTTTQIWSLIRVHPWLNFSRRCLPG